MKKSPILHTNNLRGGGRPPLSYFKSEFIKSMISNDFGVASLVSVLYCLYPFMLNLREMELINKNDKLVADLTQEPFGVYVNQEHISQKLCAMFLKDTKIMKKVLSYLGKRMKGAEAFLRNDFIPFCNRAIFAAEEKGKGVVQSINERYETIMSDAVLAFFELLYMSYFGVFDRGIDFFHVLNAAIPQRTFSMFSEHSEVDRYLDEMGMGGDLRFKSVYPQGLPKYLDMHILSLFENLYRSKTGVDIFWLSSIPALQHILHLNGSSGCGFDWYRLNAVLNLDRYSSMVATDEQYINEIQRVARIFGADTDYARINRVNARGAIRQQRLRCLNMDNEWMKNLQELVHRKILTPEAAELMDFVSVVIRMNERRRHLFSMATNWLTFAAQKGVEIDQFIVFPGEIWRGTLFFSANMKLNKMCPGLLSDIEFSGKCCSTMGIDFILEK